MTCVFKVGRVDVLRSTYGRYRKEETFHRGTGPKPRSTRQETALFVYPYNIHLRDENFSFLNRFYIKESWYNISCMDTSDMYKNG